MGRFEHSESLSLPVFIQVRGPAATTEMAPRRIRTVFAHARPDVVIHTAGITSASTCEHHADEAWRSNVAATENVATSFVAARARLVYVSTDHVFARGVCTESTAPHPLQVYGRTKLEGEVRASVVGDALVVRLLLLYGSIAPNGKVPTVDRILYDLRWHYRLRLDDVLIRYPTHVDDVAAWMETVAMGETRGTLHVSAAEGLTQFGMAQAMFEVFGMTDVTVEAVDGRDDVPRPHDVFLASAQRNEVPPSVFRTFRSYLEALTGHQAMETRS